MIHFGSLFLQKLQFMDICLRTLLHHLVKHLNGSLLQILQEEYSQQETMITDLKKTLEGKQSLEKEQKTLLSSLASAEKNITDLKAQLAGRDQSSEQNCSTVEELKQNIEQLTLEKEGIKRENELLKKCLSEKDELQLEKDELLSNEKAKAGETTQGTKVTEDSSGGGEEMSKVMELQANLHMTIMERQKLFEELTQLREAHETATFELAEIQQEHDALKIEAEQLRGQLSEWEHLMNMVRRKHLPARL